MNTRNLYDYTISEKTLINNPVFSHRQICVYQKSYMTFERLYTCFRTLSELFPYSHPRACFYYCYSHPRVQRVLDIHRFPGQTSSPSVIADLIFLTVIPRLNRGIQEIPGSRYACPRMTEEKIILSLPDLIRQSTNTRHLLTICTQKATRFDKVSRRSRCCGQAGYSLSFPCFYSFLSCSALPRTSNRSVTLSV